MIVLDFKNLDPGSFDLGPDESKWVDQILDGAFLGAQIFKVNDMDFSGDYPILGFAQRLHVIAYNLSNTGSGGAYVNPEYTKESRTEFSLAENQVVVQEVNRKTRAVLRETTVPLSAFVSAINAYRERVLEHCRRLCPALNSELVNSWLVEYPETAMPQ